MNRRAFCGFLVACVGLVVLLGCGDAGDREKYRIVLVGDVGVGKTSLIFRYLTGRLPDDAVDDALGTVLDHFSKLVPLGDRRVLLEIWNTPGSTVHDRIRIQTYTRADVFLVCYAVDNRRSFENVRGRWIPELTEKAPGVPVLLVGCQADRYDLEGDVVDPSEARALQEELGLVDALVCSARKNTGVEAVFEKAREIAMR